MFAYQNSADLKLHFAVKSMELMETTRAKMRAPFQRQWPTVVQCTIVYLNRISLILSKHGLNFGNVKFRFLWTRFILYPRLQEKNFAHWDGPIISVLSFWVLGNDVFSESHGQMVDTSLKIAGCPRCEGTQRRSDTTLLASKVCVRSLNRVEVKCGSLQRKVDMRGKNKMIEEL